MRRHHSLMLLVPVAILSSGAVTPVRPATGPDHSVQKVLESLTQAADTKRFLTVPGGALDALIRRVREKSDRPIVVVQYGDSHTQAGYLSRALRDSLAGGALASPGFVAPGWHNVGDATCRITGRWQKENWLKSHDVGSFGPLGTAYVTHDSRAQVNLHLKAPPASGVTVSVLYRRSAKHLPFRIVANGEVLQEVLPKPIPAGDHHLLGVAKVTLPPNTADVQLQMVPLRRSKADLRLFGFLVQYPHAAVEWDALGVTGTVVEQALHRGDSTIEEYLALRQPDLVVVWYGSNSLVAPHFDPLPYSKEYTAFLDRIRAAAPQAARLAIGPPDLARRPSSCPTWASPLRRVRRRIGRHRYRYRWVKRRMTPAEKARWITFICNPEQAVWPHARRAPRFPVKGIRTVAQWDHYLQTCQINTLPAVAAIDSAQQQAAEHEGFAYFDTYAFMDGAGSIHRWVCQQPQLARFDHVHLTIDGYDTVAQGIWAALAGVLQPAPTRMARTVAAGPKDRVLKE